MGKHRYRITVEPLDALESAGSLQFQAESHDDILALADRVGRNDERQLRLLVGLKLFSGVLLEDKDNPLYQDFLPHFGQFMKKIKGSVKPA